MPRILNYTQPWLSRPSPGFELLAPSSESAASNEQRSRAPSASQGPRRTIVHRGTEIFVAVHNEIRWTDLVLLKENWEDSARNLRRDEEPEIVYRTLKVSVPGEITQLVISPQGDYLAVLTASHTAHIVLLPSTERFTSSDSGALRPKTWQLGPTQHVRERGTIAACLWHPLGQDGSCLITITRDAIVRLWELNTADRTSFSEASLTFDLKKLANASTAEEDLRASIYGAGLGFSPDAFEMEVASACFGGKGYHDEAPWAATTLWIAMRTGGVYALCPLLPSRWQPPAGLIQQLGVQARAKLEEAGDGSASDSDRATAELQRTWVEELEGQDPIRPSTQAALEFAEVYKRPRRPGAIAKLQGPFNIVPEADLDFELADIAVLGFSGSDPFPDDDDYDNSVSAGNGTAGPGAVIFLLTSNARVLICLDLDGVEGQWLPTHSSPRGKSRYAIEECTQDLLLIEAISLNESADVQLSNPAFTADGRTPPSLFVTHDAGVSHLSFEKWLKPLSEELLSERQEDVDASKSVGGEFRVKMLLQNAKSIVEMPLSFNDATFDSKTDMTPSVAVVLEDSDIGYFLLTSLGSQPWACTLGLPESDLAAHLDVLALGDDRDLQDRLEMERLAVEEARQIYQPPGTFWQQSQFTSFLQNGIPPQHRKILAEEIKLSPASFNIFYEAHKIIGNETQMLQEAVAQLFRRVERIQDEWQEVTRKAAELNSRIETLVGGNEEFGDSEGEAENDGSLREQIGNRVRRINERQRELNQQYDRVATKARRATGKELSDRERAWGEEIRDTLRELGEPVEQQGSGDDGAAEREDTSKLRKRYDDLRRLNSDLSRQARGVAEQSESGAGEDSFKVPDSLRRKGIERVMELLERETALVEAVSERVERLTAGMVT